MSEPLEPTSTVVRTATVGAVFRLTLRDTSGRKWERRGWRPSLDRAERAARRKTARAWRRYNKLTAWRDVGG